MLLALLVAGLPATASAQQAPAGPAVGYMLDKAHSRIQFSIGHFLVSSTEGQFTSFDGRLIFAPKSPETGTVTVHVAAASISTDNAARDAHLRTADFFDAPQFPVITFHSINLVRVSATAGKLSGTLTLHGVSKPVTLDVTLKSPDTAGETLNFSARTILKRSDFGMTNYMGVIGNDVTLSIDAQFDRDR